jgi:hypothetical protein
MCVGGVGGTGEKGSRSAVWNRFLRNFTGKLLKGCDAAAVDLLCHVLFFSVSRTVEGTSYGEAHKKDHDSSY